MSEERLRTIVRDGLDSLPLPPRFNSPSLLIPARKPLRRSLLIIAAAAACLVLAMAVSPLGGAVVRAVSGWFITDVPVRQITDTPPMPEWMKQLESLKPGESLDAPVEGADFRQLFQAFTFSEVAGDWPLPVYRAPAPDTRVIFNSASDWNGSMRALTFDYKVKLGKQEYIVSYRYHTALRPRTQEEAEWDARASALNGDPATSKRQKVLIKGQESTAVSTDGGKSWTIMWFTEVGSGGMWSDLPLAELVKIVDSIPSL